MQHSSARKTYRILVVRDIAADWSAWHDALLEAGFEVDQTPPGQPRSLHSPRPDLLVIDCPDAIDTCARMRSMAGGGDVPILLIAPVTGRELVERAFEAGATDVVASPVDPTLLSVRAVQALRVHQVAGQLAAAAEQATVVRSAIPDVALVLDRKGLVLERLDATRPDWLAGQPDPVGRCADKIWPGAAVDGILQHVKRTLRTREEVSHDYQLAGRGGRRHYEARFIPQGRDRVLVIVREVTGKKTAQNRISDLATRDTLTGLPNRQHFLEIFDQALSKARLSERGLGVLYIDVSDIGQINRDLGRAVGDAILQRAGDRLAACVANTSAGPTPERIAPAVTRWRGDQFAAILEDVESARDVGRLVASIREAMREPFGYEAGDVRDILVTPSIGVAIYPQDGNDVEGLIRRADIARCDASANGQRGTKFFTDTIRERGLKRLDRVSELRQAIHNEQFALYYQPKVAIDSDTVVGVEALLRWIHPLHGPLSSQEFIPLAEHSGLIVPIGEWVLGEACRQAAAWRSHAWWPLRIAVNLSSREFLDCGLVEHIGEMIAANGIEPQWLGLEITESTLTRDADVALPVARRIKDLGVALDVDDFGTEQSSLKCLSLFPIDAVKIDRSFVQSLQTDAHNAAICSAVVAMAHQFGVRVIAEGVEAQTDLRFLRDIGCDEMQGFVFCEALPAEEFERLMEELEANREGAQAQRAVS